MRGGVTLGVTWMLRKSSLRVASSPAWESCVCVCHHLSIPPPPYLSILSLGRGRGRARRGGGGPPPLPSRTHRRTRCRAPRSQRGRHHRLRPQRVSGWVAHFPSAAAAVAACTIGAFHVSEQTTRLGLGSNGPLPWTRLLACHHRCPMRRAPSICECVAQGKVRYELGW